MQYCSRKIRWFPAENDISKGGNYKGGKAIDSYKVRLSHTDLSHPSIDHRFVLK